MDFNFHFTLSFEKVLHFMGWLALLVTAIVLAVMIYGHLTRKQRSEQFAMKVLWWR